MDYLIDAEAERAQLLGTKYVEAVVTLHATGLQAQLLAAVLAKPPPGATDEERAATAEALAQVDAAYLVKEAETRKLATHLGDQKPNPAASLDSFTLAQVHAWEKDHIAHLALIELGEDPDGTHAKAAATLETAIGIAKDYLPT